MEWLGECIIECKSEPVNAHELVVYIRSVTPPADEPLFYPEPCA